MLGGETTFECANGDVIVVTSISLYISQYLSKYAFKVSPSRIDNDNNKLRGQGTLLFVMKQQPKASVSCL